MTQSEQTILDIINEMEASKLVGITEPDQLAKLIYDEYCEAMFGGPVVELSFVKEECDWNKAFTRISDKLSDAETDEYIRKNGIHAYYGVSRADFF